MFETFCRDLIQLIYWYADTIVPVITSKVSTAIRASNLFIPDLPELFACCTLLTLALALSLGKHHSLIKNGAIV